MSRHLDLACVKLTNTAAKLTSTEAKLTITKAKLTNTEAKLNETSEKLEATRKVVEKLGTRIFIWKINDFKIQMGEDGNLHSVPFYTDRTESNYGYKLKVLIDKGRYVRTYDGLMMRGITLWIVLMKGEYDAILPWPFKNKLKITLIDQQEDLVERENFVTVFIPENNQDAFAKPVNEWNTPCVCCRIPKKTLYSRRYLVDDTLFLQFEVSPP